MASVFSEEFIEKTESNAKRELEREERGLELRDTKSRVQKYDRLKKKNKLKVREVGKGSSYLYTYQQALTITVWQNVRDKKLRSFLMKSDLVAEHAARKAARSELLLQEEPG